jgi:hypothetical protein
MGAADGPSEISIGIAPNDALSWRGSIGTEIRPNNEGKNYV